MVRTRTAKLLGFPPPKHISKITGFRWIRVNNVEVARVDPSRSTAFISRQISAFRPQINWEVQTNKIELIGGKYPPVVLVCCDNPMTFV